MSSYRMMQHRSPLPWTEARRLLSEPARSHAGGKSVWPEKGKVALLQTYWTVPARQIAASVMLANPSIDAN
jgi:hypothetical protein